MAAPSFTDALKTIMDEYDANMPLKDMQLRILKMLWEGDNFIIAALPTGYGKSQIFHVCGRLFLKKLHQQQQQQIGMTVVVAQLTVIQLDQIVKLWEKGVDAIRLDVNGRLEFPDGTEKAMDATTQAELEAGKYQLIFAHPEALLNSDSGLALLNSRMFCQNVVSLVFDECHTISTWGKDFRKAFKQLHKLTSFFSCPVIALTATLTEVLTDLPNQIGLLNPSVVSENPDKLDIFFQRELKPGNRNVMQCSQAIYMPELDRLKEEGPNYPVTLCYMPLGWCVNAQKYAIHIFGEPNLYTTQYGFFFSSQNTAVLQHMTEQLRMNEPRIRLVFCTPALSMGFDSPYITRIIHAKPPRSVIEFVHEIGRAGRQGQESQSLLNPCVNSKDCFLYGVSYRYG